MRDYERVMKEDHHDVKDCEWMVRKKSHHMVRECEWMEEWADEKMKGHVVVDELVEK